MQYHFGIHFLMNGGGYDHKFSEVAATRILVRAFLVCQQTCQACVTVARACTRSISTSLSVKRQSSFVSFFHLNTLSYRHSFLVPSDSTESVLLFTSSSPPVTRYFRSHMIMKMKAAKVFVASAFANVAIAQDGANG